MGVGCLLYCCLIKVLHATTRNGRQKWLNDTLSVCFLHGFVRGFRLPENGFAGKMRVFVFQAAFALPVEAA